MKTFESTSCTVGYMWQKIIHNSNGKLFATAQLNRHRYIMRHTQTIKSCRRIYKYQICYMCCACMMMGISEHQNRTLVTLVKGRIYDEHNFLLNSTSVHINLNEILVNVYTTDVLPYQVYNRAKWKVYIYSLYKEPQKFI